MTPDRARFGLLCVALAGLAGGIVFLANVGKGADVGDLEAAYDRCAVGEGTGTLDLGEHGGALIIDTGGADGTREGYACVLEKLGTSDAVLTLMNSTSASMGLRTADDGPTHYEWTLHPDNRINMVITQPDGG